MVSTKKNKLASLKDPNTLKSGHVKKLSSGTAYVVKRNKEGVARYIKAQPDDVKCSKTLKKNVSEMLNEVKKNKNKQSYSQALAIAYSKTQKKYPKCQLVQKTNNKTNKTKKLIKSKYIQNGGKRRVKLQRKIIKLLIKRNYIRTQDGKCNVINGDNIRKLYKDLNSNDTPTPTTTTTPTTTSALQNIKPIIKNIKYKKQEGKMAPDDFIKLINNLINNCQFALSNDQSVKINTQKIIQNDNYIMTHNNLLNRQQNRYQYSYVSNRQMSGTVSYILKMKPNNTMTTLSDYLKIKRLYNFIYDNL